METSKFLKHLRICLRERKKISANRQGWRLGYAMCPIQDWPYICNKVMSSNFLWIDCVGNLSSRDTKWSSLSFFVRLKPSVVSIQCQSIAVWCETCSAVKHAAGFAWRWLRRQGTTCIAENVWRHRIGRTIEWRLVLNLRRTCEIIRIDLTSHFCTLGSIGNDLKGRKLGTKWSRIMLHKWSKAHSKLERFFTIHQILQM